MVRQFGFGKRASLIEMDESSSPLQEIGVQDIQKKFKMGKID